MDEKTEQLEQNMVVKLEQMEHDIIKTLNGRLPKIDKVFEKTHVNKGNI